MVLFLVFSGVPVSGQHIPTGRSRFVADFPENIFVRNLLLDEVLGPIEAAVALSPDVLEEPGFPYQVQFFIEETKEYYYFCFYHGKEINFASPVKGSLFFQRSREDGGLVKMKVFYKNDPGSYFSIEPVNTGMSRMNIFLLGRNIQQDINIPESLQRIARMSVQEIMTITKGYVNWSFYLPDGEFPPPVLTSTDDLTDRIRPYLRQLGDEEDGAIDETGRYVYIRDGSLQGDGTEGGLNCSGFAKWVVDGVLYPRTGSLLSIDTLKIRHPDSRGNRWSRKTEDQEEPYFGLDWTRNLALQAFQVFLPEELHRKDEEQVIEIADVNYLRYHEYEEDVGYPIGQLPTALYELARRNVDRLYLGSVNTLVHGEYELRKHYHVAVFLPWLDSEGGLQVSVMERNHESELEEFIQRYEGSYIHLVEVPHPGAFTPGDMKLEPVIKRY